MLKCMQIVILLSNECEKLCAKTRDWRVKGNMCVWMFILQILTQLVKIYTKRIFQNGSAVKECEVF